VLWHQRVNTRERETNKDAQALYRKCGYVDSGLSPRRVQGTIMIRTGPIEVDDTLLTWEKRFQLGREDAERDSS
jgi:hypothetical protein